MAVFTEHLCIFVKRLLTALNWSVRESKRSLVVASNYRFLGYDYPHNGRCYIHVTWSKPHVERPYQGYQVAVVEDGAEWVPLATAVAAPDTAVRVPDPDGNYVCQAMYKGETLPGWTEDIAATNPQCHIAYGHSAINMPVLNVLVASAP